MKKLLSILLVLVALGCKEKSKVKDIMITLYLDSCGYISIGQVLKAQDSINKMGGGSILWPNNSKMNINPNLRPDSMITISSGGVMWDSIYNKPTTLHSIIDPSFYKRYFFFAYRRDGDTDYDIGWVGFEADSFPSFTEIQKEICKRNKWHLAERKRLTITEMFEFRNKQDYENFTK